MKIKSILNLTAKLLEVITIGLLVLMLFIISYQVFLRFVMNNPTSWSEELSILLLIWFGNLGMVIGVRERKHMSIDYLYQKLSKRYQDLLDLMYHILLIGFSAMMIRQGMHILKIARFQRLPATGISRGFFYSVLLVAGALNIIYCLENCYDILKGTSKEGSEESIQQLETAGGK